MASGSVVPAAMSFPSSSTVTTIRAPCFSTSTNRCPLARARALVQTAETAQPNAFRARGSKLPLPDPPFSKAILKGGSRPLTFILTSQAVPLDCCTRMLPFSTPFLTTRSTTASVLGFFTHPSVSLMNARPILVATRTSISLRSSSSAFPSSPVDSSSSVGTSSSSERSGLLSSADLFTYCPSSGTFRLMESFPSMFTVAILHYPRFDVRDSVAYRILVTAPMKTRGCVGFPHRQH